MADSDDEFDRKRRDKFRGERTEYGRESRRDDRRREDWIERDSWTRSRTRSDYRDYRGGGRDRYSPAHSQDISPPVKRMRTDWEDRRYGHDSGYSSYNNWSHEGYGNHSGYRGGGGGGGGGGHSAVIMDADVQTQPPMMSFKAFLLTQDDNITDEEAMRKYNEYKLEFRRQQLNEFFVAHKEEEWFKIKYHPEDSVKRKDELTSALKNRVSVFLEFLDKKRLDEVSVDADQTEQLVKLLDAVVIRLEGGTEFDLQALDEQPPPPQAEGSAGAGGQTGAAAETDNISTATDDEGPSTSAKPSVDGEEEEEEKKEAPKIKVEVGEEEEDTKVPEPPPAEEEEVPSKGKHRRREYESDSLSESGEETDEPAPPGEKVPEEPPPEIKAEIKTADEEEEEEGEADKETKVKENGDKEEGESTSKVDEEMSEGEPKPSTDEAEAKPEAGEEDDTEKVKPRGLHRTASIFLRNLAPTITKLEVEAMCKRYPGFLRVAIADPQPDRRWFRRGWITFERNVNIKEICWSINNTRLRDCELGAIVNRDLSRRIRTVSGITPHKQVVRNDIKLCARIIHNMDRRWSLWGSENDQTSDPESSIQSFGMASQNPVLHNITDYLIEEASAEEEELLGHSADQEEGQVNEDGATVERDNELIKVLDRLLFYLRIVHSVDYYNHSEYPNEDEMPNRCGIMHARGIPPSSKVTQQEVSDYSKTFEQKIASFLQTPSKLTDDDCSKLGMKDPETEVEKFIQANTQELAKDKWLCPLSGKKFKGPEFVRKHIFNKHGEKIEEVKKEVEYYNNYLRDPKRPQLPEHPGSRTQRKDNVSSVTESNSYTASAYSGYGYSGYGGGRHAGAYGNSFGGYPRDVYSRDAYRDAYSRPQRSQYSRGRQDYRPVIQYRDLDAPRETEDF